MNSQILTRRLNILRKSITKSSLLRWLFRWRLLPISLISNRVITLPNIWFLTSYLMGQLVIADVILVLISTTGLDENHSTIFKSLEFIIKYPFWFWMVWQFFKPKKWYWGILQFVLFLVISSIAMSIILAPFGFYILKMKGSH